MQEGIPSYMERITPRGNVEGSNDTDFNTASRKGYQVWDAVNEPATSQNDTSMLK